MSCKTCCGNWLRKQLQDQLKTFFHLIWCHNGTIGWASYIAIFSCLNMLFALYKTLVPWTCILQLLVYAEHSNIVYFENSTKNSCNILFKLMTHWKNTAAKVVRDKKRKQIYLFLLASYPYVFGGNIYFLFLVIQISCILETYLRFSIALFISIHKLSHTTPN